MKTIKLIQRYSGKCETPEEIKAFNDFYDLEEARLEHESKMQRDWNETEEGKEWAITVFMEKNF